MENVTMEVLSGDTNAAVLRFPGRQYPGVLIQGDTLSTFFAMAQRVVRHTVENDPDEAQAFAEELAVDLGILLGHYETVLREHQIEIPYVSPFAG